MMKRRVLALLTAAVLILGMSTTAFAADVPKDTDSKTVTVEGVESTATMTAYQLIDGKYNENGFLGYVWAAGMTNAGTDVADPSAASGRHSGRYRSGCYRDLFRSKLYRNVRPNADGSDHCRRGRRKSGRGWIYKFLQQQIKWRN